jgi:hypothetical protein
MYNIICQNNRIFFHGNGLIIFPLFLMGTIRLVYVLFSISPTIWNGLRTYTEVPLYVEYMSENKQWTTKYYYNIHKCICPQSFSGRTATEWLYRNLWSDTEHLLVGGLPRCRKCDLLFCLNHKQMTPRSLHYGGVTFSSLLFPCDTFVSGVLDFSHMSLFHIAQWTQSHPSRRPDRQTEKWKFRVVNAT